MKIKALTIAAMMIAAAVALAGCAPAAHPPTPRPLRPPRPPRPLSPSQPRPRAGNRNPVEATAAPAVTQAPAAETAAGASPELTAEELKAYDGKEGRPAYVAIGDTIYDVTDVPQWRNGVHNGNTAGNELDRRHQKFASRRIRAGQPAGGRQAQTIGAGP